MTKKAQKGVESNLTTDAAKQIVKRRRPDRSEALSVHAEEGDNKKYLMHSLHMWDWEKPDMTDDKAVRDRVQKYFQLCADDDMKPSVEGLAVAFDVDRKTIVRWVNGEVKSLSNDARLSIKKAYTLLNLQMADYMQNGRINPVAGIFLMKNNMSYADQTEVVLTPNNPTGDATDQRKLEADYIIETTDEQTNEQ
jgi:hypothetical protein